MSSADLDLDTPDEGGRRLQELAGALASLRSRAARSGGLELERRLAVAGAVLLPLGIVLVLLAWYGAAHTSRVYLQIPYLISGGLLGVVVAVTGGFCYFAHWLTRLVAEERQRGIEAAALARETADTLARIESLLARQADGRGNGVDPAPVSARPGRATVQARSTRARS